mgnify:FL=1
MERTIASGRFRRGPYAWETWQITREPSGSPYRLTIAGEFYASGESRRDLLDELNVLDTPAN